MADVLKVSLVGTLPGGEVMSVNPVWHLTTGDVVTYAEATAIVAAVNAIVIPSAVKNMITTGCAWTGCRVKARAFNGDLEILAEGARTTPVAGTGAGDKPFQTAMVMSLRTPTPGGRGRGRLYWPATAVTVSASSLRVSAGDVSQYLTGVKSYLALIQTALETNLDEIPVLAVWSRTALNAPHVNQILMGDILDTQRRRRDNVPESYSAGLWP